MNAPLRIGAKLPNSGDLVFRLGVGRMAASLEAAGFDSVWVSDHVVFPHQVKSRYPFAPDGRVTWPLDDPYLEPVVALGAVSATTQKVQMGTAALILPMRNPVLFAKQAACIDALSGGRLVLGVGAGWLREEFEALGADFDSRGEILDEWLGIARACWTGKAEAFEGVHYRMPEPIYCMPAPAGKIPVLIAGMSRAALRRAAAIGDGWLAQYSLESLSERDIGAAVDVIRHEGAESGRGQAELDDLRVVVRVTGAATRPEALAPRMRSLAEAGVTELIVDVSWDDADGPARTRETLRAAANVEV